MKNERDRTFLISVHLRWARAFFLSHNPAYDLSSGKVALAHPSNRTTALSFIQPCHREGDRHSDSG